MSAKKLEEKTDKRTDSSTVVENATAGNAASETQIEGHAPAAEVDRLMFLVKEASAVRGTASFLERRGVETYVSNSLQDILDRLAKGWSKYLLLSINFPHPKVDMIPTLLFQSFQAEVMVFAESSDRKTNTRLTGSKAKHVIFGPPSGPVVLMRLKQMQRGMEEPTESGESNSERSANTQGGGSDQVRISGGANANVGVTGSSSESGPGAIHLKGASKSKDKDADSEKNSIDSASPLSKLMQALGGSSGKGSATSSEIDQTDLEASIENIKKAAVGLKPKGTDEERLKKKGVVIQRGSQGRKGSLLMPPVDAKKRAALKDAMKKGRLIMAENPKTARKAKSARLQPLRPDKKAALRNAIQKGTLRPAQSANNGTSADPSRPSYPSSPSEAEAKGRPATPSANAANPGKSSGAPGGSSGGVADGASSGSSSNSATGAPGAKSPTGTAIEKGPDQLKHAIAESKTGGAAATQRFGEANRLGSASPMMIVEKCMREALARTCGRPRESKDVLLEYRVASVLVLSPKEFSGSVMIAVGSGSFDHKSMLQKVESTFLELLSECGFEFSVGEMNSYSIEPMNSAEAAFLAAEFTAVSRSAESEVGMAFLDITPKEVQILNSHGDMLEISVDQIEPEVPLQFEVFIYLPLNNRYLKYLKVDSKLSSRQSARLVESNVTSLFLDKKSEEAFKQHATVSDIKKQITKKSA